MQALLSFDQAPPFSAPFRFFLTAPLFAMLAGVLLLWSGPELLASRWTPAALAVTHLITVGFMLQVMLGAMIQILPVVAGANMIRSLGVARLVHATIVPGALLLATGLLTFDPLWFRLAALALGFGLALFLAAAGHALHGVPSINPTILGLKLALTGLIITAGLGILLAIAVDGSIALPLPLLQLTTIHIGWGFVGWSAVLLFAVALVVVPMFQMTPPYPPRFASIFPWSLPLVLSFWSLAHAAGWPGLAALLTAVLVMTVGVFAVLTLHVQRRSKRARFDATQHYWRVAMLCALAACALSLAGTSLPALAESREWPLLCGVLALFGSLMSVMIGMLYKIVPFLVWLHLQNLGGGQVVAPTMNKVIAAQQIERQMQTHFAALALLLAAVIRPDWFAHLAGVTLVLANGLLLRNLLGAVAFYQQHRRQIKLKTSSAALRQAAP